ncbi:hypothetical protein HELRODRAFT_169565 [Helobdella robusta]|uniref:AMP-dependent synthetase/ligase domain-containing protein n=1 Tax=Helobdella robusta TaxID=6412 RepID=T1F238_HELRO|nr:hypothetical protein HELRODRAFT_169565 [Helobdella robusta]ESO07869.1 hypothetical protein HELRODRAFT_169565 [Helobdella robusta]
MCTHLLSKYDLNIYLGILSHYKVSTISTLPFIANKIAKSALLDSYDMSGLKEIVCGTAPLSPDIAALLVSRLPNVQVRQAYGLTECSGMCSIVPGDLCNGILPTSVAAAVGDDDDDDVHVDFNGNHIFNNNNNNNNNHISDEHNDININNTSSGVNVASANNSNLINNKNDGLSKNNNTDNVNTSQKDNNTSNNSPNNNKIKIKELYGELEDINKSVYSTELKTVKDKTASIGTPLPGVKMKILCVNTEKVLGPLQPGELLVKCSMVMAGYRNAMIPPEQVPRAIDENGWLHSGDLAYFDEDGYLYIIDRLKDFIKFRSIQVSPVEIESVLMSHHDVIDAGVFSVPHPDDGFHPAAWAVVRPGSKVTGEQLQQYVAERVACYKELKGGVDIVEKILRSQTGKILRRSMYKINK